MTALRDSRDLKKFVTNSDLQKKLTCIETYLLKVMLQVLSLEGHPQAKELQLEVQQPLTPILQLLEEHQQMYLLQLMPQQEVVLTYQLLRDNKRLHK